MTTCPSGPLVGPPSRSRRQFLRHLAAGAAGFTLASHTEGAQATSPARGLVPARSAPANAPFKLRYAPSLGTFEAHVGKSPIDQLKFMADQGFRAFFDNGLPTRPAAEQEAIAREADRLNLLIGPFVAYSDFKVRSLVLRDGAVRYYLAGYTRRAVETHRRTGARWALVVPGRYDESLEWDYQTANVVENLKWIVSIFQAAGLVMVLEPLNPHDHPGLFLTRMPQAYAICKAVGSPTCKIVDDLYHQQITEGNLLPNIERCWDEIAAFHVGDNPGRKEPGTGEINYRNIFKRLYDKKYEGAICLEHGRSRPGIEGEKLLLAAYRAVDDFGTDKGGR
jgi:sugar phosphate isomerase/epimerase